MTTTMFGPRKVTLVMHGSLGGYQEYEVLREGDVLTFGDYTNEYAKIIQTTEGEVVGLLEEHEVPHEREWDSITLDFQDADRYMRQWNNPKAQDHYIGMLTDHPSARVEGHITHDAENTIKVEYTYIPGL